MIIIAIIKIVIIMAVFIYNKHFNSLKCLNHECGCEETVVLPLPPSRGG
jgi:hypothetical protein